MKKRIRPILTAVLLTVFVVSSVLLALRLIDRQRAEESQQLAEETAGLQQQEEVQTPVEPPQVEEPPEEEEPVEEVPVQPQPKPVAPRPSAAEIAAAMASMDIAALQAVNPDVRGWILIPGTGISYPLVQGTDNEYYLNHTWDKQWNTGGAIFLDCQSPGDFSSFNTIIYGHRMDFGSMFGLLHNYKSEDYWRAHPYVYLKTPQGIFCYEIFAGYEAAVDSWTYAIALKTEAQKLKFIDSCVSRSVIDTGVVPTLEQPVLTLSTCTGRGYESRWVVQACLLGPAESMG